VETENNDDDASIAGWSITGLEARVRHFKHVWGANTPCSKWLDLGCGAGTYTRYLAEHQMETVGLDYSLTALEKARARFPRKSEWVAGDANCLPFKDKCFDGILCFGVSQALESSESLLKEIIRVSKPGSQVWIDGLNAWSLPNMWDRARRWIVGKPMHLRYESPARLKKKLYAVGVHDVQLHWLPIFPRRWQRFQWIVETRVSRWVLRQVPLFGIFFSHAFVLNGLCRTAR
jgi:ubiquinone/menaquinone biosynthesis C-methylase UbiE